LSDASSNATYGPFGQAIHWTIAALVVAQLAMGKLSEVEPDEGGGGLYGWHTSIGLLVLALAVVRTVWRLTRGVPAQPAGTAPWQRRLATLVHAAFYVLLFALPLSGWLLSSAEGDAVFFFGRPLPLFAVAGSEEAEELFEQAHELLGNLLLLLAVVHVIAALKHHFIDRDDVLRRMLPLGR
jgi:cytochrome b561